MYTKLVDFVSVARTKASHFLQRWRWFRRILAMIANISATTVYTRIRMLQKHISISLMAVMFAGGTIITSSQDTKISLASLFPPDPSIVTQIVDGAKVYTPSIQADTATVVDQYTNPSSRDYIDQLSILAIAQDNPLKDQGILYTVEAGDTYSSIAAKFQLKTSSILAANGIDASKLKGDPKVLVLQPGDKKAIPFENIDGPQDWVQITQEVTAARQIQSHSASNNKPTKNTKKTKTGRTILLASSSGRDFGSYSGFAGGWCTAYAAKNRPDIGNAIRDVGGGNAGIWGRQARIAGFQVDKNPEPGAVLVTAESAFGHVSIITAVNNGSVEVSEMNGPAGRGRVNTREIPTSMIRDVIH